MLHEKTKFTPRHKPGFADRLHVVLDNMNIPQHGRKTFVAKLTGMTVPGAKALFDNDRPPKNRENFNELLRGLAERLGETEGATSEHLEDYLLNDSKNHYFTSGETEEVENPVYLGQIYIKISEIAADVGVELFTDIEKTQLEVLYRKVIAHCREFQPDPESSDVRATVESLIHLAKKKLL